MHFFILLLFSCTTVFCSSTSLTPKIQKLPSKVPLLLKEYPTLIQLEQALQSSNYSMRSCLHNTIIHVAKANGINLLTDGLFCQSSSFQRKAINLLQCSADFFLFLYEKCRQEKVGDFKLSEALLLKLFESLRNQMSENPIKTSDQTMLLYHARLAIISSCAALEKEFKESENGDSKVSDLLITYEEFLKQFYAIFNDLVLDAKLNAHSVVGEGFLNFSNDQKSLECLVWVKDQIEQVKRRSWTRCFKDTGFKKFMFKILDLSTDFLIHTHSVYLFLVENEKARNIIKIITTRLFMTLKISCQLIDEELKMVNDAKQLSELSRNLFSWENKLISSTIMTIDSLMKQLEEIGKSDASIELLREKYNKTLQSLMELLKSSQSS